MKLERFSVTGEEVIDERGARDEYGDLPLVQAADPTRKIRRYESGASLGVTVRLNEQLLTAAQDLPLIICRLAPTDSFPPESEMTADDRGLEGEWIKKGLAFYWDLPAAFENSALYACYLADRFGPGANRIYYFVSENPEGFRKLAEGQAREKGFAFESEQTGMARVGRDFLPIELIGQMGFDGSRPTIRVKAGFGFNGQEISLQRLRAQLERNGYQFDEAKPYLGELRMAKEVPIDRDGFLEELQTIVPLSRSMGCSYMGEETVLGGDQFLPTVPLPERYSRPKKSMLSRFLGR